MIREIRKLAKTNRAKANYIRCLQDRKAITRIISDSGYVCYDTDELKNYHKNVKKGRPLKV